MDGYTIELQDQHQQEIASLVNACKRVAQLGYVTSHGGNLSSRVSDDTVLITPTKVPKGEIGFDDICIIDMAGKTKGSLPGRRPTGEWPFHVGAYAERVDFRSLIHAHPEAITAFAIAHNDLLSRPILPEPVIEVGPVLNVRYETPLSEELAMALKSVIRDSNAFLMLNHGVLIGSPYGISRTAELLEMIEATANSITRAQLLGGVKELQAEDLAKLDAVIKKRAMVLPGEPGRFQSLTELYFQK